MNSVQRTAQKTVARLLGEDVDEIGNLIPDGIAPDAEICDEECKEVEIGQRIKELIAGVKCDDQEICDEISKLADELIALHEPLDDGDAEVEADELDDDAEELEAEIEAEEPEVVESKAKR